VNKVFRKRSARLLERFHIVVLYVLVATARLPPRQWGATRRRQARGGTDCRRHLLYPVIPVSLETYGFLSLTIFFIPSKIWLGLILLLQYFILNRLISMFIYVRFLYALFVVVMFYLRINLKLKLLFILSTDSSMEKLCKIFSKIFEHQQQLKISRKPTRSSNVRAHLKHYVGYKHDISNFISYKSCSPSFQNLLPLLIL
jgi:hypothetical protein